MKTSFFKKWINSLKQKIQSVTERLKRNTVISFILRVARELGEDNAGDMAAGIAYYAFLAIFPLLLGVIAILGLFLDSETMQTYIFDFSEQYLPNSIDIVEQNIEQVVKLRGTLGIISIIGLFWTGSAIFAALGRIINRAWDVTDLRPFYIRKLRDLILAFSTGILFFISMGANSFSSILPIIDLPVLESLVEIGGRLVAFILLFIIISALFKYVPNKKIPWGYIWPGAVFTTIVFEIARTIFTFYLGNFASYNLVYGSLAAVIILLVWIYISAFILIIGAEFSSEYAKERSRKKAPA